MSLHGDSFADIATLDRMPTVSAAEALGRLKGTTGRGIRTGLEGIDKSGNGGLGVKRCQVTEIYGPPGVGKTTLG